MIDFAKKSDPALLARRYSVERRFKAYGALALALSVVFLVYLVVDIVVKAAPTLTENTVRLTVNLDPAQVDAKAIDGADFSGLLKTALRDSFPTVTARGDKKALGGLLSIGAGDELRDMVKANPGLIGTSTTFNALLSDEASLYLKGLSATVSHVAGSGALTLSQTGDDYAVSGNTRGLVPGVVLRANGGALRIANVTADGATAVALVAPEKLGPVADGTWSTLTFQAVEADRQIDDKAVAWLEILRDRGVIGVQPAWRFLTAGDSREPELSGLRGAIIGSLLTLLVTLGLSVPLGIAAAIYLEEFAPKNRWTDFIEVNINNLAAVPSIIFGLLGLAVFLNFFGMPRSSPAVGGLVLALLVLPTIIIASRAALKAVPPSIKEAALGVGASHQQAIFHHVLPLAIPGILTGTILGVARALGETAPLLMIGMVAFIADIPKGLSEAATVLPVQIYLWSDLPEIAFQSRTAAAIVVLLILLFCLNAIAIYMRRHFERRW
jgi:phosphate transport system permease protein